MRSSTTKKTLTLQFEQFIKSTISLAYKTLLFHITCLSHNSFVGMLFLRFQVLREQTCSLPGSGTCKLEHRETFFLNYQLKPDLYFMGSETFLLA